MDVGWLQCLVCCYEWRKRRNSTVSTFKVSVKGVEYATDFILHDESLTEVIITFFCSQKVDISVSRHQAVFLLCCHKPDSKQLIV